MGQATTQACWQAFQAGGFLQPFVDASDFYTVTPDYSVAEADKYKKDLAELQKNLTDPTFLSREAEAVIAQLDPESGVLDCLGP